MNLHQRATLAVSVVVACPTLAHAHHPMGKATPSNLFEGLASGIGHPVIGIDHLLFVLAVGVACYAFKRGAGSVLAFLAATLAGTTAHLYQANVPYAEAWVAVTLVVAGVLLLTASPLLKSGAAAAFFALAGLAHGYAYGEAIVGAEPTPLAAYLIGFTIVQLAIVIAGFVVARTLDRRRPALRAPRAFGGALSVAGAAFLVLALAG